MQRYCFRLQYCVCSLVFSVEIIKFTPPKINMEPENGHRKKEIPFGNPSFSGFGGVSHIFPHWMGPQINQSSSSVTQHRGMQASSYFHSCRNFSKWFQRRVGKFFVERKRHGVNMTCPRLGADVFTQNSELEKMSEGMDGSVSVFL